MSISRRMFLQGGSTALVTIAAPSLLRASQRLQHAKRVDALARAHNGIRQVDDPAMKALLLQALEAARDAGATYADARYMTTLRESKGWNGGINYEPLSGSYQGGMGVRALYNGYWGYAALIGNPLTLDSVARLGREATGQARTGAKGRSRVVDLAPTPVVDNGTWVTPIQIDPFSVAWDEKLDVMNGVIQFFGVQPYGAAVNAEIGFIKDSQAFVSSEGSSYTQILYRTEVRLGTIVPPHWRTKKMGSRNGDSFASMASAGWEHVLRTPAELEARRMLTQARDATQAVPVDVGRYDVVFDGAAIARLIDMNLGPATELDRAMGYSADDEGTSFLNDPLEMVGNHRIGSGLLTLTANRSMPGGVATVQWDDEGVCPDDAVLVKDGVLTDFQTTRESAGWLASYYEKTGKPVRSHGGALCGHLASGTQQGPHNLVMTPSSRNSSFVDLCAGVKKGLAVMSGTGRSDQQALNGEFKGDIVYEINNGKLGRVVDGAVFLTRAPDLWRNLIAIGGPQTVCALGLDVRNEGRTALHTVSAPAAVIKQVAVTTNAVRDV